MKKQKEQLPESPKFHDTWLLLRKYRDVVWGLELSVQQVKRRFQMEFGSNIEDFLESIYIAGVDFSDNGIQEQARSIEKSYQMLKPHILDISQRTFFRRRRNAIEALSSILWGYTSQDSLHLLEQFFPEN